MRLPGFIKQIIRKKPKVGDRVRVTVGFGSTIEGVVTTVCDGYCWVEGVPNQLGTASFSYCVFEYL